MPNAVLAAIELPHPVIRSDGTPERDFLYVDDAVAAHLAIYRGGEISACRRVTHDRGLRCTGIRLTGRLLY
jgi:nucleoside-diphosphate-sugar epimerase